MNIQGISIWYLVSVELDRQSSDLCYRWLSFSSSTPTSQAEWVNTFVPFFFLVLFGLNGRTLLLNPLSLSAGYVSPVCRSSVHYYILFKIKNENKLFPLFSFPTLCIKRNSVLRSFSKNLLLVLKSGFSSILSKTVHKTYFGIMFILQISSFSLKIGFFGSSLNL